MNAFADRLHRFAGHLLYARRPAWTIALVRILFGGALLSWTVSSMVDASIWFADDGLVPPSFASTAGWNVFSIDSTGAAWLTLAVLLVASVAIMVGWYPTPWLVVAFVLLVALQRRNPLIINSGDLILRNLALLLAFCPTRAALSVDRWRREGREALWTAPLVAPWGLRLVQLQMVVVYFFAFWSKNGQSWHNGTAVSTALRLDDLQRFPAPWFMIEDVSVVAMLTWGALAIELALAAFLWYKPLRPWLIVLAVMLHFFIDGLLLVGFFGPVMIIGLLSFVDADWLDRKIGERRRGREPMDDPGIAESDQRTLPDGSNVTIG